MLVGHAGSGGGGERVAHEVGRVSVGYHGYSLYLCMVEFTETFFPTPDSPPTISSAEVYRRPLYCLQAACEMLPN